jgi:parallel beta-helix repeat protein
MSWTTRTSRKTSPRKPGIRVALLLAAVGLVVSGCGNTTPEPLVRREAPPAAASDPAKPCTRMAAEGTAVDEPAPAGISATLDRVNDKIVLTAGQNVTLPALSKELNDPALLREVAPGEWQLGKTLEINQGASLKISAPTVRWLKLRSDVNGYATLKGFGGGIDVSGTCITSWDEGRNAVDDNHVDGRSFILARDGSQMTIDRAELHYLGFGDVESYGLSWRTEGSGGHLTNSLVTHLYFGVYSFGVGGLVISDNEVSDNVLYGIDPHTGSHNLTIERNVVHDNGKHGIILAENCTDSVIRDNVVYRNQHHGIVLYLHSDRNVIEGNESFANAAQGVNINESSNNTIRSNRVYDNTESGIGVGQTSTDNVVQNNDVRGNQQDGLRLVSEANQTDVRDNVIGENVRYGVYVDSDGSFAMAGNTIWANRTGVLLKGTPTDPSSGNSIFDNRDFDVRQG